MGKAIIYYGDGSKSEDPSPPARNVQIIVQEHPHVGWHTECGNDYYVPREGRFVGVDIFGLFDWCLDNGVLFGRTITTEEYEQVLKKALADLGDRKRGWTGDEKRLD